MTLSGLVLIAKVKWRWPNIIQNKERARIPSRHVIKFSPRSVLHNCVQWLWYENIRINKFWFNFEEFFEFKYEAIPTTKHHVPQNKAKLWWFFVQRGNAWKFIETLHNNFFRSGRKRSAHTGTVKSWKPNLMKIEMWTRSKFLSLKVRTFALKFQAFVAVTCPYRPLSVVKMMLSFFFKNTFFEYH